MLLESFQTGDQTGNTDNFGLEHQTKSFLLLPKSQSQNRIVGVLYMLPYIGSEWCQMKDR